MSSLKYAVLLSPPESCLVMMFVYCGFHVTTQELYTATNEGIVASFMVHMHILLLLPLCTEHIGSLCSFIPATPGELVIISFSVVSEMSRPFAIEIH